MAEFIHKRTVVHQYRHFLKAITKLPETDRPSAKMEIQTRFRLQQAETADALSIQMALKEGERQLAQLQSLVGYKSSQTLPSSAAFLDKDSWINTPDPEDPRGRVGDTWPWQVSSK
jgi:hypothetical protein